MTNANMSIEQIKDFLKDHNFKYYEINDIIESIEKMIEKSYQDGYEDSEEIDT